MSNWQKAQKWELNWHETCVNSLYEEEKQIIYAEKMGLVRTPTPKTPYHFDLSDKTVLDIGSGPYSLLLKCTNYASPTIAVDPLMNDFPKWVRSRYRHVNIKPMMCTGESLMVEIDKREPFDEVWIYNVLQHTIEPKQIIRNALSLGKVIRIFEWLDTPPNIGHPRTLKEESLNKWLQGEGKVEVLSGTVKGKAYYGVFKGKDY